MKKFLSIIFFPLIFLSCGNREELNIYTWTYFIPDEIIQDFEKETGIKVNMSYYDTNDTMFAKLLSGTSEYDIISPSTDFVTPLIQSNLVEKLDKTKLNNVYNNLNSNLKLYEIAKGYDKDLNYSIPYMMFATGITVNKKYVDKNFERDLSIFENEKYKGRMSMLDDSREVLGMTLQYLGYPSNSENEKELEEAKQQLLKWKKNLAKFDNNAYSKNVLTGELYVVHGYADAFYQDDEKNGDIEYFLPKGAMLYIDNMAITKNGKNKENAYKFLNFLYEKANYKKFLDEFRTISILDGVEATDPILPAEEVIKKAKLPLHLSEKARILHDKIWTEIKLEQ